MNKTNYSLADSSHIESCDDEIKTAISSWLFYKVVNYFINSIVAKGYQLQGSNGLSVKRNGGFLFWSPSYSYNGRADYLRSLK